MAGFKKKAASSRGVVTVRPAPGGKSRALVHFDNIVVPAAIGRSGRTIHKREGDGATPIAAMPVLYGFTRRDRVRSLITTLSIKRIRQDMLWCDEQSHPSYNRLVRAPFRAGHEEMKRSDGLYDICLVLDWNIRSRVRNRGSAIFFHIIKPGYQPTAGCVAVRLRDMQRLIRFMRKGTVVRVL